jgi:hypothetical protein
MTTIDLEELSRIILYQDPTTSNLILDEIKNYLTSKLESVEIETRIDYFSYYFDSTSKDQTIDELAKRLANTKVRDITDPTSTMEPLLGEINFEKRALDDPRSTVPGILYDGYKIHQLFQDLLPSEEIERTTCHIIFTPRLFGTFDKSDRRYHARDIICGYPSIISTTGLVEAPAKPREYYKIKQSLVMQNITTIDEFIPEEMKNKYLVYNDPRLTEVVKGYAMQVVFYHLTSEPFCTENYCRLFNAHWQEEMLQAQLTTPEFCDKHEMILEKFNSS